ncbi:helix-turn-helix domain-containing protein [Nitrosopumilus sp. b3]|uniref:helix-turn-helix domain-containing protein n=1 Tax=Nitrosopumilus sp. b3 TaxID=2109909 RepID=UPI0015F44835|nr:helix-turn-helix domain-containing protein [Nitrosopumilus sp. b3]
MREEILKKLKTFGLGDYESRVYFTLQVNGKTKAGMLWKEAGVPQSKIYYLLDALEMKGLVEQTQRNPREVRAKSFLRFANEYLTEKKILLREIDESIKENKYLLKGFRRRRVFS